MPILTRWFVRSAMLSLILGLTIGVWQQVPGAAVSGVFPVYLHLLTFGWLTQLIFGIAMWMFPSYNKEHPRGPEWLGWGIFATLNGGLLLRVIFEPLQGISASTLGGWMLVSAAILQWLAGVMFFANVWVRVKGK
ncbi:MAG TPA: hypothetical protein VGK00_03440 [Anaerolineales bacterium]|jgi:hypothetical protein